MGSAWKEFLIQYLGYLSTEQMKRSLKKVSDLTGCDINWCG